MAIGISAPGDLAAIVLHDIGAEWITFTRW